MARRLSSPIFVGRSNELSALLSGADAAALGESSLALIGGEAGVGKSRLVAEVAGRLRDRDWLVLEGGSVPLGDDGLPFGPIVEALRALPRNVDPEQIAAAAGPSLPELARLVPELSGVAGGSPAPAVQAEWLQVRVFEGVLRLLGRLGETAPVLLVVEDLQWADRSTRDLLSFLVRNVRNEHLLMIATIRTEELMRRHPMAPWLAEAKRQSRVERFDLARFDHDELVALLTGILGSAPPTSLVDAVARRSDGNAFFAEELVAANDETRQRTQHLPETLRGVLLVRLSDMSETATRLIEIAAVAGRQVEHDVLADVCGLSDVEMRAALHEAVGAQLLVADLDRYQFRHALVQEAAYDELLPSERRVLHAAYARAIEARPARGGVALASRLVELSHHWMAAEDPIRALAAAVKAGDASRAVYAYAEATRQYERAIELWDVVPATDRPTARDQPDLYDEASQAALLVGDTSRAVALARREMELVDGNADPGANRERRARARERLSLAAWQAGDIKGSIELAEEAVDLYDDAALANGKARVLAALAHDLMLAGRSAESVPIAERAIESARATGDQGVESRALNVLGVDLATLGNVADGIDLLRRSLAIASPADDPTLRPSAYTNLGSVLGWGGLCEEALEVSLAGVESTLRDGSDVRSRIILEGQAADFLIELGRYPEAAELLDRNVARVLPGSAIVTIFFRLTMARLALLTGDLEGARRHLDVGRSAASGIGRGVADAQFVIHLYAVGTEVALWEGDPTAALMVARDGFDRITDMDDAMILGELALPAARAGADLAVRKRAARDPAGAEAAVGATRDVIERYGSSTERLTIPDALAIHEIGWRMALCTAELARARGDDDPARWDAVRPALAKRPAPLLEAYVLWRKAEALADQGDAKAAAEPLREAHTIAVAIGAPLVVEGIETVGRRLRVDLTSPRLGPARAEPPPVALNEPFGLSKREREVLPLVAMGFTNRRIAETLFISESTAGVHVSNILGKLGVETRTQAAAVAVRLGLDKTPTAQ